MLKNNAKKLLFQSLSLPRQMRLIGALLDNIVHTASMQDVCHLEDLFASVDLLQTSLEDRIRQLKLSGRTVPDPPTTSCRTPCVTWVMEDHAPRMDLQVEPIAMPGMISDEEARYYE